MRSEKGTFLLLVTLALGLGGTRAGAQEPPEAAAPTRPEAPTLGQVGQQIVNDVKQQVAARATSQMPGVDPTALPAAAAAVVTGKAAVAAPQTPEARQAMLRRKVLRDEDFVESDDNRDPFRSFLSDFVERTVAQQHVVPAVFEKFALEELTLIAIVSGVTQPMAMFRDPGGLGQVLRRGDYLSKSAARVTKILPDRVILELTEISGSGEARALEKAVLVNPEAAQQ
jgi:hypothetical protein